MKSSDAYPEPDLTDDGALEPGSTATGDPSRRDDTRHPDSPPSPANPDALVEHNRVGTAEDME